MTHIPSAARGSLLSSLALKDDEVSLFACRTYDTAVSKQPRAAGAKSLSPPPEASECEAGSVKVMVHSGSTYGLQIAQGDDDVLILARYGDS